MSNSPLARTDPTGYQCWYIPEGGNECDVGTGRSGEDPWGPIVNFDPQFAFDLASEVAAGMANDMRFGGGGGDGGGGLAPGQRSETLSERRERLEVQAALDRAKGNFGGVFFFGKVNGNVSSGRGLSGAAGRIKTTQRVNANTGEHSYMIRGTLCSGGAKCNDLLADKVYAHVNRNDIPFTSDDLGSGVRRLLGTQPILHLENSAARTTVNITLEGHFFFPGDVTHSIHFDGPALYYDVVGAGSGSAPSFNNWLGITLFTPGVQSAVDRFGF